MTNHNTSLVVRPGLLCENSKEEDNDEKDQIYQQQQDGTPHSVDCFVLWRHYQGQPIYTGIVALRRKELWPKGAARQYANGDERDEGQGHSKDQQQQQQDDPSSMVLLETVLYKKLHDPYGPNSIFGDGHLMSPTELQTEMCHYATDDNDGQDQDDNPEFSLKHNRELQPYDHFLTDYFQFTPPPPSCKKPRIDYEQEEFDVTFPVSINNKSYVNKTSVIADCISKVRAGDRAKLSSFCRYSSEESEHDNPSNENQISKNKRKPDIVSRETRFWVEVVSVTIFGTVTARVICDIADLNLKQDDLISFSATRILGLKHGPMRQNDTCCSKCGIAGRRHEGAPEPEQDKKSAYLMPCQGCVRTFYCSQECQLSHWHDHCRHCDHAMKYLYVHHELQKYL